MTNAKQPTYPCALCGRHGTADQMMFSSWTRNRYCGTGRIATCEKRYEASRRKRKVRVVS